MEIAGLQGGKQDEWYHSYQDTNCRILHLRLVDKDQAQYRLRRPALAILQERQLHIEDIVRRATEIVQEPAIWSSVQVWFKMHIAN